MCKYCLHLHVSEFTFIKTPIVMIKEDFNIGWENYYQASDKQAWKEEPEPFLIENIERTRMDNQQVKVLDVASGDGRNTFIFTNDSLYDVCCIDLSNTALLKIADYCQVAKLKTPLFIAEDFLKVNFCPNQFDIVICFDGLSQMENPAFIIERMCHVTKPGGKILFNYLTKGDCAYGIGKKINENSYLYKETLFSFLDIEEILSFIPDSVDVIKSEVRKWDDPPHGEFRPMPHTHEAAFFVLKKV